MGKYKMSIDFNVLNHLGINLYSNISAVLSEVVANSYDADATVVNIDIFQDKVVITDNGCGMTLEDVNKKYLLVGYQKREGKFGIRKTPKFGRNVMGRKGIGKLSLMSLAKEIEVYTIKDNIQSAFRISVDEIVELINSEERREYEPKDIEIDSQLQVGTKIVLKNIRPNHTLNHPDKIKTELARRFVILNKDFLIKVNSKEITFADRRYFDKVKKIFIYGKCPIDINPQISFFDDDLQIEIRDNMVSKDNKYGVNGWIGYVNKSDDLKDGSASLNKISLLTNGKLGQDDILQELHNTSMFTNYLIGEIDADFLDGEKDLSTSSREGYQKDSMEYIMLSNFLKDEISHIGSVWNKDKEEQGVNAAINMEPKIEKWYDSLEGDEKKSAKKLLGKVNTMITNEVQRKDFTKFSILAFEKMKISRNLSILDKFDEKTISSLQLIFDGVNNVEESMYYQIVKQRMDIIDKFEKITNEHQKEKVLHEFIYKNLWLLDPSWERPTSNKTKEVRLSNLFDGEVNLTHSERNARLDIRFKEFAGKTVIVELKRYDRIVTLGEIVDQVSKYSNGIKKILRKENPDIEPIYEIIILLGKHINNDSSVENCKQVVAALKPFNSRVVFYDELISNARNAYKAYFDARDKINPILDIFNDIDD